jgi:hypothetical protein
MAENGSRIAARGRQMYFEFDQLRDGEERYLKVLELAKEYGAAVVVGTIDEEGMARTAEGKLKIAHRAYKQASNSVLKDTIFSLTRSLCRFQPESKKTDETPPKQSNQSNKFTPNCRKLTLFWVFPMFHSV